MIARTLQALVEDEHDRRTGVVTAIHRETLRGLQTLDEIRRATDRCRADLLRELDRALDALDEADTREN